jgi:hypothetical protein
MGWHIYLNKARNNLRTAQLAYDHDDFDSCVSRAYFAVFQVEIASLLKLTSFRQERWGHDRVQGNLTVAWSVIRRCFRDRYALSTMISLADVILPITALNM